MKTTRRSFLKLGGVSLGATAAVPWLSAAEPLTIAAGTVAEAARRIPIAGEADVIVCGAGPAGVSAAVAAARKGARVLLLELHGCLGGVWKDVRIVATGSQVGVREGRRLRGLYTVSTDDLHVGREHKDAVCQVTFGIDVHATDGKREKGIEKASFRAKPYDIPVRALIAKDVSGLMMAGRCISGDFLAHSSYRVTGNAVAMGEAAGKVAAVAATTKRLPQEVKVDEWKG